MKEDFHIYGHLPYSIKKFVVKKYLTEIVLIIICSAVVLFAIRMVPYMHEADGTTEVTEPAPVKLVWGFPIDSIRIDTFKVRPNQNLSDILSTKGVSAQNIDQLAKNSKDMFDVRRIKSGNPYYIISRDTSGLANFFIYQESAIDYVVYNLDSLNVYRGQKQIDTLRQSTTGIIETSLWNSFVDNGSNPTLALELSDIFAWTIDFFGIQKGDQYKVLYDELFVEGKFVGIGQIYAASFINLGDTVYAYYYNENDQEGYFDNKGQSLKKAFLKAPLKFSRISGRFTNDRFHPILKKHRSHHGVDYAAPLGTPVHSIGDGVVVKKAYQKGGGGNYINIKHNSVYTSQYMHLNGYAKGMAPGVRVKQGQLIGYVGKTGLASGPHLDFRIYKNGTAIDPLKVKAPPVEPIKEANMANFSSRRDSFNAILETIQIPKEQILSAEQ